MLFILQQLNTIQLRCKASFFRMLIILGAFGSVWFYKKKVPSQLLVKKKIWECKELSNVNFLGSPALAETHNLCAKAAVLSSHSTWVWCWWDAGECQDWVLLWLWEMSRTIPRQSPRQIKHNKYVPAFITAAQITILSQTCSWHRNAKALSQGRLKETVFHCGHFSLTLSFFSRC